MARFGWYKPGIKGILSASNHANMIHFAENKNWKWHSKIVVRRKLCRFDINTGNFCTCFECWKSVGIGKRRMFQRMSRKFERIEIFIQVGKKFRSWPNEWRPVKNSNSWQLNFSPSWSSSALTKTWRLPKGRSTPMCQIRMRPKSAQFAGFLSIGLFSAVNSRPQDEAQRHKLHKHCILLGGASCWG